MEYYLAINQNKTMLFEGMQIGLEIIMLSETSQTQKHSITFYPIGRI